MRVLVVEDYKPIRDSVVQGLREADFAVDEAENGRVGLEYANTHQYDVIVLDLMLPEIGGLTILKKIRESESNVCVLLLTALDEVEHRVTGLESGADDYLVKPFALAELLARVKTLVRRKYDTKSTIITVGDLQIDTARRHVQRGGVTVELTAREYVLLEYLAMRSGEIVSRSDIWAHVYDFHDDLQSNVVDVYIGYLRKKIEAENLPRLIQTRRGQGYVLGEPE